MSYLAAFLDRNNIGFAKLEFTHDLGMTEAAWAGGRHLLRWIHPVRDSEQPLLARIGARKTLTRIMLLWGAAAMGTAFVTGPVQLYVMRFLLGAAEAGFFPGAVVSDVLDAQRAARPIYVALHDRDSAVWCHRQPDLGWIMQTFANTPGLRARQWLLLLEGLPACILGLVAYVYLTDSPAEAAWLDADARASSRAISSGRASKAATSHGSLSGALRDGTFHLLALMAFALFSASTGFFFWLPTILRGLGVAACCRSVSSAAGCFSSGQPARWSSAALGSLARAALAHRASRAGRSRGLASAGPRTARAGVRHRHARAGRRRIVRGDAHFLNHARRVSHRLGCGRRIAVISTLGAVGGFVSPTVIGWIVSARGRLPSARGTSRPSSL